ncbi:hypothetical protein L9F63_004437, partial [Diploptera punctata]
FTNSMILKCLVCMKMHCSNGDTLLSSSAVFTTVNYFFLFAGNFLDCHLVFFWRNYSSNCHLLVLFFY